MLHIAIDCINALGLFLGLIGSFILARYTYGYESPSFCGNDETVKQMIKRNVVRKNGQKRGFLFLFFGFICQFIALLTPYISNLWINYLLQNKL